MLENDSTVRRPIVAGEQSIVSFLELQEESMMSCGEIAGRSLIGVQRQSQQAVRGFDLRCRWGIILRQSQNGVWVVTGVDLQIGLHCVGLAVGNVCVVGFVEEFLLKVGTCGRGEVSRVVSRFESRLDLRSGFEEESRADVKIERSGRDIRFQRMRR